MTPRQQGMWTPWRMGYRAALSGLDRNRCPHLRGGPDRDAWFEGYNEAERDRPEDVAAVRAAVGQRCVGEST